jgi:hypothetical protein
MKKLSFAILIALSLGSLALASAGPAPKRITFKSGQSETTVHGFLKSRNATVTYLLKVRAHQTITVVPCGDDISISTDIKGPKGSRDNTDRDMQGNSGYENTVAGDYLITVAASKKDDRRNGNFCIDVKVENADHAPQSSAPAQGPDLFGYFFIKGKAPQGFADIDVLNLAGNGEYGAGAKPPFYGQIRLKNRARTDYKLLKPTMDGSNISFKTKAVGGVSYEFEGTFRRLDFTENQPVGDKWDEVILSGTLRKMRAGQTAAQSKVDFRWELGG